MLKNKGFLHLKASFPLLLVAVVLCTSSVQASRPGWQREEVDLRVTGGGRIKAIYYPQDKPVPTLGKQRRGRRKPLRRKALPPEAASRLAPLGEESAGAIFATVIDSPPIDGFVPWVAVAVTDKRHDYFDMIFDANDTNSVEGNYLTANPEADYAVGIFDTGASGHVMAHDAATQAGLSGSYLTSTLVEISGVTGSVWAVISQPIGIFVDGIGAVEPNGLNGMLYDTSGMVGEWNTTVAVGDAVESPNLPTVIGTPLSVYFATEFRNDQQITVTHNGEDSNSSPDMFFYELSDPCCPSYPNVIPLELRPSFGVFGVQYVFDPFDPFFSPISPSIIMGAGLQPLQSVFFVHSVDLYEGDKSAIDKDRFMFDTGAQVTVIGSRIVARLGLDPADPNFEVPIQGVTGDTIMVPGFYIDVLEIPAIGEWLSFTKVPVIFLDVPSPEGGTLDGIIGMNLFVELNFVLRGGGMFLQDDPRIEFGPIPYHIIADIAPRGGDGVVDFLDLAVFVDAWPATKEPRSPNWNPKCDMAPISNPDGVVDFRDFAVLAGYWRDTAP
jgi:predicted aspartyl protease